MRDGNAPNMARWLADGTRRLVEWETDTSSQTGASQAGILLGSNEDVPGFRWVDKERGELMVCSNRTTAPRSSAGTPATACLCNGGASRGNLLSGEADHVLLTSSPVSAEKKANPGYQALLCGRLQCHSLALALRLRGRSSSSSLPPDVNVGAMCVRADTVAASTRCYGRACAS
jgi:hypothetical protein